MKRTAGLIVLGLALSLILPSVDATASQQATSGEARPSEMQQGRRSVVWGYGQTQSEAQAAAENSARVRAGRGRSYQIIRVDFRQFKSGSYQCRLDIETK